MKHPKKSFVSVVLAVAMVIICFLLLCSCAKQEPEMLPDPQNFQVENRVITWDPVENASGYLVTLDNKEYRIEENSFNYHFLDIPDTYTFSVIALGDGRKYGDSVIAYHEFVLAPPVIHGFDELGFEYTYLQEYDGYEVDLGTANYAGMVTIPDYFCDWPVKRLAREMFGDKTAGVDWKHPPDCFLERYCNGFTTGIKLPAYLESIGEGALAYILYLEEIVIPDTVVEIEREAFRGCKNLKKVVLPQNLKIIPGGCFRDTALSEIILPESLEEIGGSAFATPVTEYMEGLIQGPVHTGHVYSTLSEIVIPASVTSIGMAAFEGRHNLEKISMHMENINELERECFHDTAWFNSQPDGMVFLGDYLYAYKGEMAPNTRIEIPYGTKGILYGAFAEQENLQAVVIPEGITQWDRDVFAGCVSLSEVLLPADMKSIPVGMFEGCISLKTITLPDGLIGIDNYAFMGTGLKSITIPASVKSMGTAFLDCKSLKEITFSAGVEMIGLDALTGCSALETVFIPASVREIVGYPFNRCDALTHVFFEGSALSDFIVMVRNINNDAASQKELIARLEATPIYCYSEEKPTQDGLFWHYVDGVPTPWEAEE